MGYYEATKIVDGPQVIASSRVQEDDDKFIVTSTPENAEDVIYGYGGYDTPGEDIYRVDNPAHMPGHVNPFLVDGILAYPTSDQLFDLVYCVAVVENMSQEDKDTFEQRHGISLDPEKHALIVYIVDAETWSPDVNY